MAEPVDDAVHEAAAWCDGRERLWTPELDPGTGFLTDWETLQAAMTHVREVRREIAAYPVRAANQPKGRLLVFEPENSLSDGAANVQSGGFFDNDNVPAWDTWVDMQPITPPAGAVPYPTYQLIAWCPAPWFDRVDRGIYVNPEGCVQWLYGPDGGGVDAQPGAPREMPRTEPHT